VSLTRINPSGENLFALGKIHFASGETVFTLKQIVFGFCEVEFMFKKFVCSRGVTERRSKMFGRFDFQLPILCGDQASISRISNFQKPPKIAK
jgi:hypothetical protein